MHYQPIERHLAAMKAAASGQPAVLARISALGQSLLSQPRTLGRSFLGQGTSRRRTAPPDAETALLSPVRPGFFSLWERRAIAAFAAGLLDSARQAHFRRLLSNAADDFGDLSDLLMSGPEAGHALMAEANRLMQHPLPATRRYRLPDLLRHRLGDRLAAGLEYAWLVVAGRGSASEQDLAHLTGASWSPAEIAELDRILALLLVPVPELG